MAWIGVASSSLTLVVIAVERYYTVTSPVGSNGKLTKQNVKVSKHVLLVTRILHVQIQRRVCLISSLLPNVF